MKQILKLLLKPLLNNKGVAWLPYAIMTAISGYQAWKAEKEREREQERATAELAKLETMRVPEPIVSRGDIEKGYAAAEELAAKNIIENAELQKRALIEQAVNLGQPTGVMAEQLARIERDKAEKLDELSRRMAAERELGISPREQEYIKQTREAQLLGYQQKRTAGLERLGLARQLAAQRLSERQKYAQLAGTYAGLGVEEMTAPRTKQLTIEDIPEGQLRAMAARKQILAKKREFQKRPPEERY